MTEEKDTLLEQDELTGNFKEEIINDYKTCVISREASLMGRREVLTGKAKFGIFGDGKEVPQVALAKQYKPGDFRAGYYRDQTLMLAAGLTNVEQFFAQLYAHTSLEHDPHSAGRQMNSHYATRSLNEDGTWKDLTKMKNTSSDISPTAGQMPRLLGLAYASKFYRNNEGLKNHKGFSNNGNEVAFGTIGDASTSEGHFWEMLNAAGVLQVPVVLSVWDDGHGISVPKKYQTTKESISEVLKGFQRTEDKPGIEILKVKGWNYAACCLAYEDAARIARTEHVPVVVHVEEITQPQGHSTSGSHERYKSAERLEWEKEFDCIRQMKLWMLEKGISTEEELGIIENEAKVIVRESKKAAWKAFNKDIKEEESFVLDHLTTLINSGVKKEVLEKLHLDYQGLVDPSRKDVVALARRALRNVGQDTHGSVSELKKWFKEQKLLNYERYNSALYSESEFSPLEVETTPAEFNPESKVVDGREILKFNFDKLLETYPELLIFGEDSGKIGGVNQGLEGLQAKYGEWRVFDTGIREQTIVGQGIGLALRGLRPIAEIQYLDYFLYAIQTLSDDLATVHYRTKGGQKCPLIIRTRGHRLEGIWHAGSPLGMIVNALRGVHVCVPRNMTQAAGMYNTLLRGDDPAVVIESLNGYRLKETLPENLGEFTCPLGHVETIREGNDITVVTYGSMVRMIETVSEELSNAGISVEIIDVQTLLPFDLNHDISKSLEKTNKLLVIDEDIPGGSSAYILQKILEEQKGYYQLDSEPRTLTAKDHRTAFGTDGDYFSKPNHEDIFDAVYGMMHDHDPQRFPEFY